MRIHMYLITEHPDDEKVGNVEFRGGRFARVTKNNQGAVQMHNRDTGERWRFKCVGLGYHDFDDEADYEANAAAVAREKFADVEDEWLEKAGVEDLVTGGSSA